MIRLHAFSNNKVLPASARCEGRKVVWDFRGANPPDPRIYASAADCTVLITGSFSSDEEANRHCAENPETAVILTQNGVVHCAETKSRITIPPLVTGFIPK